MKDKYHAIVENAGEGVVVSQEDKVKFFYDNARISIANKAWTDYMGYERPEDMIGLGLEDFMSRSSPENEASVRKAAENDFNMEGLITHEYSIEGDLNVMENNTSGEIKNGHLIRAWGTARDTNDKEKDKQKLIEAEKRYRTVADFTYD